MAALDFPASPTTNQLYTGTNGATYQWDGTVWRPASTATDVAAGGDLSGSYPNPTVVKASNGFAIPASGATASQLVVGPAGAPQARMRRWSTQELTEWSFNRTDTDGQDNAAKPTWNASLDVNGDAFTVGRKGPAGSWAAPLQVRGSDGALVVPGNTEPQIVIGSGTVKGRLLLNSTNDNLYISTNNPTGAQDNAAEPSWVLNLASNVATDAFKVRRSPAGSTALADLLTVRGSDGKTVCSLADASVSRAMISPGAATTAPVTTAATVAFNYNSGVSYLAWKPLTGASAGVSVTGANQVVGISCVIPTMWAGTTSTIYYRLMRGVGQLFQCRSDVQLGALAAIPWPIHFTYWDRPGSVGTFSYSIDIYQTNANGNVILAGDSVGFFEVMVLA